MLISALDPGQIHLPALRERTSAQPVRLDDVLAAGGTPTSWRALCAVAGDVFLLCDLFRHRTVCMACRTAAASGSDGRTGRAQGADGIISSAPAPDVLPPPPPPRVEWVPTSFCSSCGTGLDPLFDDGDICCFCEVGYGRRRREAGGAAR